ncbi:hypothetical protein D3C72_2069990 [compost metagenome]
MLMGVLILRFDRLEQLEQIGMLGYLSDCGNKLVLDLHERQLAAKPKAAEQFLGVADGIFKQGYGGFKPCFLQ